MSAANYCSNNRKKIAKQDITSKVHIKSAQISPKLCIFKPQIIKNRKPGYPGFEPEKPDPLNWEKPGF